MRALDFVCSCVCERRGRALLVVRVSIWVFISCASNRTRDKGVDRSSGVSVGLLVLRTRELANVEGENVGERKVS